MRIAKVLGLWLVMLAGVASAATVFNFGGACTLDCTGFASATLTLQNYTPGDPITLPNFVSFSYFSTFLGTVNVTNPIGIGGPLGATPGPYNFGINDGVIDFHTFDAVNNGFWCVGVRCLDDEGVQGTWTLGPTVPEPASALLILGGLAAVAGIRRLRTTPDPSRTVALPSPS